MSTLVAEKDHAVLGPSGWSTWGACPGSIALSEGIANTSSTYAKEGTAAHALAESCLQSGLNAEDFIGQHFEVEGETFTVDMEMADAVNTHIAWVQQYIDPSRGDVLLLEQSVPIGQLTGETDAEGTSDVVGICDGGKTLVVIDLKYGKGVQVYAGERCKECHGNGYSGGIVPKEPELCDACEVCHGSGCDTPNGQLAMYGLGTLEKLNLVYDEIERVKLVISQPRLDWIDEHELSVEALLAFGEEVTLAAGRVALNQQRYVMGDDIELNPGEKQCKFCKAKAICPALKEAVSRSLSIVSNASDIAEFNDLTLPKQAASVEINPEVPGEKLAEVMRAAPLIETMITAVRAEVERRLFAGQPVPGFKLVQGKKGNRQWTDEEAAAEALTKPGRLKASEAYKKTPISPTQAEKKLKGRPKVWGQIAPLITQSPGKPSVAPESDPRPVYTNASAIEDFADLTQASEADAQLASLMD
jgi:hypothetical protein